MTTSTIPVEHVSSGSRLRIDRIGLWLFIASESMLFAGVLASRFSVLGTDVHEHVEQWIGLVITSILLLSSYTAFRAEHAARNGDAAGTQRYLTLTLFLGAVFVAGVAYEWVDAFDAFPPDTDFGTIFFTMTGIHAFHVITGLVFLLIVFSGARRNPGGDDYWPVEASVKYWHFVDVVWVFFYPALYLI